MSYFLSPFFFGRVCLIGLPLVLLGWKGFAAAARFFGLYVLFSVIHPAYMIFPALVLAFWPKTNIWAAVGWSLFLKALGLKFLIALFLAGVVLDLAAYLLHGLFIKELGKELGVKGVGLSDLIFWFSLTWAGGIVGILLLITVLILAPRQNMPGLVLLLIPYFPVIFKLFI